MASGCDRETVDASSYDAYWLWAGVKPQPVLDKASGIYFHYGDVKAQSDGQIQVLRPQTPKTPQTGRQSIWMVVRVETLAWDPQSYADLLVAIDRWKAQNPNLRGLQIDFDARTKHLHGYADFLRDLRRRLPYRYRLSITGLLDWSANGDPEALRALGGIVDEIVLQTYQGRKTIPGYENYLAHLDRLNIQFKIGLVQGGQWKEPKTLSSNPDFRGYVVFLVNPESGG